MLDSSRLMSAGDPAGQQHRAIAIDRVHKQVKRVRKQVKRALNKPQFTVHGALSARHTTALNKPRLYSCTPHTVRLFQLQVVPAHLYSVCPEAAGFDPGEGRAAATTPARSKERTGGTAAQAFHSPARRADGAPHRTDTALESISSPPQPSQQLAAAQPHSSQHSSQGDASPPRHPWHALGECD